MNFTLFTTLLILTNVSATFFKFCDPQTNLIGLTNITLFPPEPVPYKDLNIYITGKSEIDIFDGEIRITVHVHGFTVSDFTLELCAEIYVRFIKHINYKYDIVYNVPYGPGISCR